MGCGRKAEVLEVAGSLVVEDGSSGSKNEGEGGDGGEPFSFRAGGLCSVKSTHLFHILGALGSEGREHSVFVVHRPCELEEVDSAGGRIPGDPIGSPLVAGSSVSSGWPVKREGEEGEGDFIKEDPSGFSRLPHCRNRGSADSMVGCDAVGFEMRAYTHEVSYCFAHLRRASVGGVAAPGAVPCRVTVDTAEVGVDGKDPCNQLHPASVFGHCPRTELPGFGEQVLSPVGASEELGCTCVTLLGSEDVEGVSDTLPLLENRLVTGGDEGDLFTLLELRPREGDACVTWQGGVGGGSSVISDDSSSSSIR